MSYCRALELVYSAPCLTDTWTAQGSTAVLLEHLSEYSSAVISPPPQDGVLHKSLGVPTGLAGILDSLVDIQFSFHIIRYLKYTYNAFRELSDHHHNRIPGHFYHLHHQSSLVPPLQHEATLTLLLIILNI